MNKCGDFFEYRKQGQMPKEDIDNTQYAFFTKALSDTGYGLAV